MGVEFCQMLFFICWDDSIIFLTCCIRLTDLWMSHQPCIPGVSPSPSRWMILAMHVEFSLLMFCWGFWHPWSSSGMLVYNSFFSVLIWFLYQGNADLIKMSGSLSSFSIFGEIWEGYVLSLLWKIGRVHLWIPLVLDWSLLRGFWWLIQTPY